MVHVRPIEAAERGPEDEESGQDPHQKRDQEIQVRGHRWRAKAGALLKNAEGRLSTLTTGTAGLWSAGRVESASMPGKQARVVCPVCAEPMPPDETEPTVEDMEEDILDLRLCPICGADNDPELEECEVCGGPLRETKEPSPVAATESPSRPRATATARGNAVLDKVDQFIQDLRPPVTEVPRPPAAPVVASPKPPLAPVKTTITPPKPAPPRPADTPLSSLPPTRPPVLPKPAPQRPETRPAPSGASPPVTIRPETSRQATIAPPLSPEVRTRPRTSARSPRTNARPTAPVRSRITAEMAGGLVLTESYWPSRARFPSLAKRSPPSPIPGTR